MPDTITPALQVFDGRLLVHSEDSQFALSPPHILDLVRAAVSGRLVTADEVETAARNPRRKPRM